MKKQIKNSSVEVIILCEYKYYGVVEYALSGSPTMVFKYILNLIDKKLLQKQLKEYVEIPDKIE